jgi:plastocyanin
MTRIIVSALALVVALAVAGCSSAPAPLPSFSGASATVTARGLAFQPVEVKLPAGQSLRLVLDNQDAGVPHNIQVRQGDTIYGTSPNVTGPGQTEVRFGPLTAGTYQFVCDIHASMIGTIVVGP